MDHMKIWDHCGRIIIPVQVTTIGAKAFEGCKKLEQITVKTTKLKNVTKKALQA